MSARWDVLTVVLFAALFVSIFLLPVMALIASDRQRSATSEDDKVAAECLNSGCKLAWWITVAGFLIVPNFIGAW
jgi:hypothetical protein